MVRRKDTTFRMRNPLFAAVRPDGFISTDSLAWQVIQTLRCMGIRVPEDVQVIGFDVIRMFGDLEPVVSTIIQPVQEIAEACVSTVLSKHLSNVPSLICLPVSYAAGGTTRE